MSDEGRMKKLGWILMDRIFPNKADTIDLYVTAMPTAPSHYPYGFSTDGCSGGMSRIWRKMLKRIPPWEWCCVEHDLAYWRGGFYRDRLVEDRKLYRCVKNSGHPVWAYLMYGAVRFGGSPLWPFRWRWGYGWPWAARYERRDPNDMGDDLDFYGQ